MKTENNQQPTKKSRTKAILIALGVSATAVLGFLGWNHYQKRKNTSGEEIPEEEEPATTTPVKTSTASSGSSSGSSSWFSPVTTNSDYPIKKGSKGEKVRQIQLALIAKYGKEILPHYGADGDFGSELQTALEKQGLPTVIDESAYNVIVKSGSPSYSTIANALISAYEKKNFSAAMDNLRKIRNTTDYSAVSKTFKTYFWMDSNPTLISKMLEKFTTSTQRDSLRIEFLRIGLKFDGNRWTLSGLPQSNLIITTTATEIIDPKHNVKVTVPKGTVLGNFLQSKEGWTFFRTLEKNKKLIVKSNTVKIYERD